MADYTPAPPEPNQTIQDKYVGKLGYLAFKDLKFLVAITKVKNRFGNIDALVEPVTGSGAQWVLASRLTGLHN